MSDFIVNGMNRLCGEVRISGGKNAVLPLLAATLLTRDEIVIRNCPNISDVSDMTDILSALGADISREGDAIVVRAEDIETTCMPEELSHKIRSSIFLLGSMLARKKEACFFPPGGCEIGRRPIDQHMHALRVMGAEAVWRDEKLFCNTKGLRGGVIDLRFPSVGATENALLAAVLAKGVTVINGAAREPEISCLAHMLRSMGAKIQGDGTGCIVIEGVQKMHGTEFFCIPDRIEACTFLAAAAATRGCITVTGTRPESYGCVTDILERAGASVRVYGDAAGIRMDQRASAFTLSTAPYPGFPTDMQAQMCALACTAKGTSHITETVFENRLRHASELKKTGACIKKEENSLYITGEERLAPARFSATDLRSGAALVILALFCDGQSSVSGTGFIDRGYENFENKLKALGADIKRV